MTVVFAGSSGVAQTVERGCVIRPSASVDLSAPVAGQVAQIHAGKGQAVARGDLLAVLEAGPERAELAIAEARAQDRTQITATAARLALVEARVARSSDLAEADLTTRARVEELLAEETEARRQLAEAEFRHSLAQLELDRAKAVVAQREVRSPIAGRVVAMHKEAGEFTGEREPVATIARIDPLRVEVFAPIAMRGGLEEGGGATVTPEPPFDAPREARIEVIDQVFDVESGTFGVRLSLDNPDAALPAGLRCAVTFGEAAR